MESSNVIRINAAGTPGANGSSRMDYASRPREAKIGHSGAHGKSARAPKDGSHGQDLHVKLLYDNACPRHVQVIGVGPGLGGQVHSAGSDQTVLLDCRGGQGGHGGCGEDGQTGGRGSRGGDATSFPCGEAGGSGGWGGDGGYGTDGANGGDGGLVTISVDEDDLDLLVACDWDVQGGAGGNRGQHGMPGSGGRGGPGGSDYSWYDPTISGYRMMPGGANGAPGSNGRQPQTHLSGGNPGRDGRVEIQVVRGGGSATWPGRYELEVAAFDMVDEDQDGIYEPGGYLTIKNIKIVNKGRMPSPNATKPINVRIMRTDWLVPVDTTSLVMPPSIAPGQEAILSGELRAWIRSETNPRPPGQVLQVSHELLLVASLDSRLHRSLPRFCKARKFWISYPLELTAPVTLRSVQQGSRVRASWTVRNVSSITQDSRCAATRFSKSSNNLEIALRPGGGLGANQVHDLVRELLPGATMRIEQEYIVPSSAEPYSTLDLKVELRLGDIHRIGQNGQEVPKPIMTHVMPVQVASAYTQNPGSQFLLVVNCQTPNTIIRQIKQFIEQELLLVVDVYNVSLTGSLRRWGNNASVLQNYRGKSIIVYGNEFDWFGNGVKSPWELFIPTEVQNLARCGTSFFFCGVHDKKMLKAWTSQVTYASLPVRFDEKNETKSIAHIVKECADRFSNYPGYGLASYNVEAKEAFSDRVKAALPWLRCSISITYASRAATKLEEALPLQRFLVFPFTDVQDDMPPVLAVDEVLPRTARIICSTLAARLNDRGPIDDQLRYGIVAALPFPILARMFWDWTPAGPRTARILRGAKAAELLPYICQAVEAQLCVELDTSLKGHSSRKDAFHIPPKLKAFLDCPMEMYFQDNPLPDVLHINTLGTIISLLHCAGLGQWIHEVIHQSHLKSRLRQEVTSKISAILHQICSEYTTQAILDRILAYSRDMAKTLKSSEDLNKHLGSRQMELTGTSSMLEDLAGQEPGSFALTKVGFDDMQIQNASRKKARQTDEAHATSVIAQLVVSRNAATEVNEDSDWVKLGSEDKM